MTRYVLIAAVLLFGTSSDAQNTKASVSDLITLREYVDVRFDAQQKAVEAALASADRAVGKAELASDKRFDSVNEFRKQLTDETLTFLTRNEYEVEHKSLVARVDDLAKRIDAAEARSAGSSQTWGYLIGAIGVCVAIVTVFMQGRKLTGPIHKNG